MSYVVIGRNEGARLRRCLQAVLAQTVAPREVIYVDGRSSDDSLAVAASVPGVRVLSVTGTPSAAKGRNVGWRHASAELIQFVDGDAELAPGWSTAAVAAFAAERLAAVSGGLVEARPTRNLYHRFAHLDWRRGSGAARSFGGIVMVRRRCLEEAGGFPEDAASGEEPLLALALRRRGYALAQLAVPMARHDIDLPDFESYWRRCVTTGVSLAEQIGPELASGTRWWQLRAVRNVARLAAASALLLGGLWQPWLWALAGALGIADLVRLTVRHRDRAGGWRPAAFYAGHLRLMAVAQSVGLCRWLWQRRRARARGRGLDAASTTDASVP